MCRQRDILPGIELKNEISFQKRETSEPSKMYDCSISKFGSVLYFISWKFLVRMKLTLAISPIARGHIIVSEWNFWNIAICYAKSTDWVFDHRCMRILFQIDYVVLQLFCLHFIAIVGGGIWNIMPLKINHMTLDPASWFAPSLWKLLSSDIKFDKINLNVNRLSFMEFIRSVEVKP